jgi:hypothetical protein
MTSVRSVTFESDSLLRWSKLPFKEPAPVTHQDDGVVYGNYGYSGSYGEGSAVSYNAVILRTPPEVRIWKTKV